MKGVDVVKVRYALFKSSALASSQVSSYPALVEQFGRDVVEENIQYVNGGGLAYKFSVDASTSYTFIATAENSVGDKITRYASVTTVEAPETESSARTFSAGVLAASPAGEVMAFDPLDKDLFPMVSVIAPAVADVKGEDIWTAIHNMKILEKRYEKK